MSNALSEPQNRSRWLRWVGTLLSLGLLAYLFSSHWDEIISAFQQLTPGELLIVMGLTLLSRVSVGTRWHVLLQATDLPVSWGKAQRITFAGLFASNFLPTTIGGDVIRLAGAVQLFWDGAVSAASLIVDRLVGMAGMALALPFGIIPLWGWFGDQRETATVAAAGMFLKIGTRIKRVFQRIWGALSYWREQPRSLLAALVFTAIHQLCLYLSISLILQSLGESVPLWQIAGLWSFVYFVTLLPISINGYGLQELSLTFFFSQVAGIPEPAALAVAALVRIVQMLASLPGALFIPAIMAARTKRKAVLTRNSFPGDTQE